MDVAAAVDQINKAFRDYPMDQKPAELYHPIAYMLNRETPRFYPLMTLWSCYLFSGDYQKAITPSLGVEMFFNFLLVHSELLDQNSRQKDRESVHEKWNQNVALLSGDAMIFKAYELLIQVKAEQIQPVVGHFNRCFTRICEGKQLALSHPETKNDHTTLEMNPGALGEFSMLLGTIVGEANKSQQYLAGKLGNEIAVDIASNMQLFNHPTVQSFSPSILQCLSQIDCPESRKQEFRQWLLGLTE